MHDPTTPADEGRYSEPYRVGAVFFALAALTVATFLSLYLRRSLGGAWPPSANTLFILGVAAAKASLVVLYFMHWKYETGWKYVLCIPPAILAIVAVLALAPDVAFDTYPRANWNGPSVK
jgi:cytochrome c oxidase subunit 4